MGLLYVLWLAGFFEQLSVLHVNYGLRGEESARDAGMVSDVCKELGVAFQIERVSLGGMRRGNLQATARSERYRLAGQICQREGIDFILTGHHREDEVETFLIKLFQGAGLRGLTSFEGVRSSHIWGGSLKSLRHASPLMGVRKEEIVAFLRRHDLPYREDRSNAEKKYWRNVLRHDLIPILEGHCSHWTAKVLSVKRELAETRRLIEVFLGQYFYRDTKRDYIYIERAYFDLDVALQRLLLRHVLGLYFSKKSFSRKAVGGNCTDDEDIWGEADFCDGDVLFL